MEKFLPIRHVGDLGIEAGWGHELRPKRKTALDITTMGMTTEQTHTYTINYNHSCTHKVRIILHSNILHLSLSLLYIYIYTYKYIYIYKYIYVCTPCLFQDRGSSKPIYSGTLMSWDMSGATCNAGIVKIMKSFLAHTHKNEKSQCFSKV